MTDILTVAVVGAVRQLPTKRNNTIFSTLSMFHGVQVLLYSPSLDTDAYSQASRSSRHILTTASPSSSIQALNIPPQL
jgi:hypothetical protein